MASRDYHRLDIYEFGRHLLETGDLDPVYIALNKTEWKDKGQLNRWLLAYWCFYHCGVASYLSEFEHEFFWEAIMIAARNEQPAPDGGRWPRGSERRHFRGDAAVKAVRTMAMQYHDPEYLVNDIIKPRDLVLLPEQKYLFAQIAERAQRLPLFGPWISFKVCDMVDRLELAPVDFDKASVFMFDDPRKAALMLWRQHHGFGPDIRPKNEQLIIDQVVDHLTEHFKEFTAPPLHDRPVGLQEIETILCKWKSHMNGHYPLYNDIHEIREGLASWAKVSSTAAAVLYNMPRDAS